jgi:hypothetical protein
MLPPETLDEPFWSCAMFAARIQARPHEQVARCADGVLERVLARSCGHLRGGAVLAIIVAPQARLGNRRRVRVSQARTVNCSRGHLQLRRQPSLELSTATIPSVHCSRAPIHRVSRRGSSDCSGDHRHPNSHARLSDSHPLFRPADGHRCWRHAGDRTDDESVHRPLVD